MAKKSLRLSVGSIFTKGPGKIYSYRYQVDGCRKTVSLQTTNRATEISVDPLKQLRKTFSTFTEYRTEANLLKPPSFIASIQGKLRTLLLLSSDGSAVVLVPDGKGNGPAVGGHGRFNVPPGR